MSTSKEVPVGARIKRRLEQLQLTQEDLVRSLQAAGASAFDKSKLSKSLSGDRQFTSEEIALIADALALEAYFIITGSHPAYEPRVAARHEFVDGEHVADWEDCLRRVRAVSSAYTQAELVGNGRLERARIALGAPTGTPQDYAPGRVLAAELRKLWCNSEYRDIVLDLPAFLEGELGIDVAIVDGIETNRAQAQAFEVLGNSVIVTVQTGSWYSAVYAVMHEVGHLLFDDLFQHDPDHDLDTRDSETFANGFAADFLMPKASMIDFTTSDPRTFARAAWEHGVGADAVARRANSTKNSLQVHLSQVELNGLFTEMYGQHAVENRRGFWRTPRFPDRLVSAHTEGVESRRLAPDCLAWMLGVPVEELQPAMTVSDEEAAADFLALL
ncbi:MULTISPECIES: ImmA/IrrE family metallo-endopeptidase [unclassified Leucobacter]|uniref:helix-turn-helix domain-containing protein n=1 Tax=unclassified Leucobacter TaxID=2621730 RepID=UPI00165E8236|nr:MULTISPECIES: ImmA/IrrE family metallo-endopeptidase [unclassified Leucobacter]MBC9927856.1 ImmA/IrrE family metallo-endopeptidase [Leucobacter sp. cx-169]